MVAKLLLVPVNPHRDDLVVLLRMGIPVGGFDDELCCLEALARLFVVAMTDTGQTIPVLLSETQGSGLSRPRGEARSHHPVTVLSRS